MSRLNGRMAFGRVQNSQKLTASGTSQTFTNAVGAQISVIRIATVPAIYVEVGTPDGAAVTASITTSALVPANSSELFVVSGGSKVAVIQDSAGGSVTLSEVTA